MTDFTYRPITTWPGVATRSRKRSPFRSGWGATIADLKDEIRHLGGKNVVIEIDCDPREIRRDGLPRSDARLRGPGVILSFESRHGPVRFPCDTYFDWKDNLRAIALAMKALRAVDRYGVTQRGEQYRGWTALPASTEGAMTRQEAARVVLAEAGPTWIDPEQVDDHIDAVLSDKNFRRDTILYAIKASHPDRGGNSEAFHRVQRARRALEGI